MTLPSISAVVPLLNEAESLPQLHRELVAALDGLACPWEILYIDDGSRDGSDQVIAGLAAQDPRVRGASFRRNFGKSAALATGFRLARGEWIATLDADLQDDPSELPKLIAALESGYDLVSGWKLDRKDPFNCGFKLYRRDVVDSIEVYGELHRFMPALAHWRGFRVGEVAVHHRPRQFGRSKFGAARFVNGFLDLMAASFISTSALKPLHVFGRIGLGFIAIAVVIAIYFVVLFVGGEAIRVRPLMLFGAGLGLVGVQLILMGLLGEMIAALGARADYPLRRRYNLGDERA